MATYSNSRVSTYETCPYQYKLHYIDKIIPEVPQTIEAFMGDLVHQTLEKLYTDKKFKDAKKVVLKWHMLAFNKEITSERTDEQLKELQEEIVEIIQEIEEATKEKDFPTNPTKLCDYCLYKSECPSFRHLAEIEEKPIKEFKEDEGVRFVDEFAEIKAKLSELEEKKEELRADLIEFAKQKGVDIVYGSNAKASVKEFDKIVLPEDAEAKAAFIKLMKDKGIYEECSMVCYPKLNSKALKGELEGEIRGMVEIIKDWRVSLSKRKDREEDE